MMNVTTTLSSKRFLIGLFLIFGFFMSAQALAVTTVEFQQGDNAVVPGETVILEITSPSPTGNPDQNLYRWFQVDGTGEEQIAGEFGRTYTPNLAAPGTFTYRANALVPGGVEEESNTVVIVVAFEPPTVTIDGIFVQGSNKGATQADAYSGDTVEIRSNGIDPDGGVVTYFWSAGANAPDLFDPANPNNIAPTNGQNYKFLAPTVTEPTPLLLTVLVTDDENGNDQGTVSKTVTVTVRPKEIPVAVPAITLPNGAAITEPLFFDPAGGNLKINGIQSSDPDGGTIAVYDWTEISPAKPLVDDPADAGNPAKKQFPVAAFNGTTSLSYDLEVTDDDGEKSGKVRATVILEPYLRPVITVNGSKTVTIFSDQQASLTLSNVEDPLPDGGSVTINDWVRSGATGGSLDQSDKASVTFTPPNPLNLANNENSKTFTFTVNASDDDVDETGQPVSNSTSLDTVFTVIVKDRGRLPVAKFAVTLPSADAQGKYLEDRVIRLEADGDAFGSELSKSNHPLCVANPADGITSYQWEAISGAAVTEVLPADFGVADANGSQFWFKARVPAPEAPVSVKLTVTDCQGQVFSSTTPITIVDDGDNDPPVAKAGNDQSVSPGATITLNGSNSSDPDGSSDIESYKWEQTSGVTVGIVNSDKAVATATAPASDATLRFTLTLTDKTGATSSDELVVNVSETNVPPNAVASASPSLVAFSQAVSLVGTGSSDPEGGALQYKWTTTEPGITIDQFTSATASFTAPAEQKAVEFQLEVTDDQGATSTASTIVNVGSGIPPVVNAGPDRTVKEGDQVTLRGTASDPDGTDSEIKYSWRRSGGSLDVTLDNSSVAEPIFLAPAVLQTKSVTFELVAEDESGFKSVDSVTITVEDNGIDGFEDGFIPKNPVVEDNIGILADPVGFRVTGGELVFLRPIPVADFETTEGKPAELPFGLWEYKIRVAEGSSATLEVQFDGGAPRDSRWFNFNNNSWSEFKDGDGNTGSFNTSRDIISLALRDGDSTDQGGATTDGLITGTGGLGSTTGTTTRTTGGTSQLGGGGSLGFFPVLLVMLLVARRKIRQ